ncbi:hypothetical protein AC578_1906 [Pseudocercospora eumusae]|uniref:CCHC-type domain-containing protein n=1 Tax=Pseudocercospora eumusae TaxID=321146 RepID=A0A139GYW4_9PEZI|nr:hypothetical protein AC578_1906 [Pseudocercospora eumusae]
MWIIWVDNRYVPLEAQLWKMIKWPMVISAYIKVNWKPGEELRRSSKRHELDGGGSQHGMTALGRSGLRPCLLQTKSYFVIAVVYTKELGAMGGNNNKKKTNQGGKKPTVPGTAICIRCPDPSDKNAQHLIEKCKANVNDQGLWPGFSDGTQSFTSNKAGDCENFLKRVQNRSHDIQKEIGCTFDELKAGRAQLADRKQLVTKQDLSHAWSTWVSEKAKEKAPTQQQIPIRTAPTQLSSQAQKASSSQQTKQPRQGVCKACGRPGHDLEQCPYKKKDERKGVVGACSNCGGIHHYTHCKEGCKAPGCEEKTKHYTWQHPDPSSKLNEDERAKIFGKGAQVTKLKDALDDPNPKAIYNTALNRVVRPDSDYACYKGPTDDSYAPKKANEHSVVTNYVQVQCKLQKIYVYSMSFLVPSPKSTTTQPPLVEIKQRAERKRVFEALLQDALLHNRQDYATDYTTLWTGGPLDFKNGVNPKTNFQYQKQSGKQAIVQFVDIVQKRILDFSSDAQDLCGPVTEQRNPNELIRALNGMMTRSITDHKNNELFDIGTNMFFVRGSELDVVGLHLQRGYVTSIRPGSDSVLLNVNVTYGAFLKPMLVSDFLKEVDGHNELRRDYKQAINLLKGRTVRIIYDRKKRDEADADKNAHRSKIISGFGDVPYIQQFEGQEKMWSVAEWFLSQGLPVKEEYLPCVNVGLSSNGADGKSRALWILPEYLEIEPNQAFGKQLGSFHMEKMHDTALQPPAVNQACIEEEGLKLLGFRTIPQTLAQTLSMTAGRHLLRIPATQLQPPVVAYRPYRRQSRETGVAKVTNASWNLAGAIFQRPAAVVNPPLSLLDLRGGRPTPEPNKIAHEWLNQCKAHGLLAPSFKVTSETQNAFCEAVDLGRNAADPNFVSKTTELLKTVFQAMAKRSPTMAVLLPSRKHAVNSTIYATVKRVADTMVGIHTICATQDKLPGARLPYYSNLVLKQNLKAEGSMNHAVLSSSTRRPAFEKIENGTLVIGVDVVHPGGFHPSIAAMVGSVDRDFATFPGHVRLQPARQEILTKDNMCEMAAECLSLYEEARGSLPTRIVYFRDGVGEDQYQAVVDQELPELTRAYPPGSRPPIITAIIVGKRHNTRFFAPMNGEDMTYSERKGAFNGNIKPGLLVDKVITMPQNGYQDFFLQSHAALQGTAKSAHYVVVRNDKGSGLTPSDIPNLCHAFCYNYARATKGVSYCSPAYYADRLCDRAHHYLRNYLAFTGRQWQKTPQEKDAGKPGEEAFRLRVVNDINNDTEWKAAGRTNPWHPKMDKVMFWL